MSLDAALSIATGGIDLINRQIGLASQNISNAGTAGYVRESATQQAVGAPGLAMGVRAGPAQRDIDLQIQASLFAQNGAASAAATRQNALAQIDIALGTPAAGDDLASRLGTLRDAFSSLMNEPSSAAQQRGVIASAAGLATSLNQLSATYTALRQVAQDQLVTDAAIVNARLTTIGDLTDRIRVESAAGRSTADMENMRDQAMGDVSRLIDVKFLQQNSGDMLAVSAGGITLPLGAKSGPFSIAPATLGPNATYPGAAPALMLAGIDVTTQIKGGSVGANLTLRDQTLPTFQAEIDEFSQSLAARFDAQGLRLFSDGSGNVPAPAASTPTQAPYVGFAASIQVNPAIPSNPALIRDGTQTIVGSPTGATTFTPNPPGGPSGFSALVKRVLSFTFGTDVQPGIVQPAPAQTGLGPLGTLTAPFGATRSLADLAGAVVGDQAQAVSTAKQSAESTQAVQAMLSNRLGERSSVSIDAEMANMVQLQQAYGANARVISTLQSMWQDLLSTVGN